MSHLSPAPVATALRYIIEMRIFNQKITSGVFSIIFSGDIDDVVYYLFIELTTLGEWVAVRLIQPGFHERH